jgi:hypothetical protein
MIILNSFEVAKLETETKSSTEEDEVRREEEDAELLVIVDQLRARDMKLQ